MSDTFSRLEAIMSGDNTIVPQSRLEQKMIELIEIAGSMDEDAVKAIVTEEIADLIDGAPSSFDTLKELSDWIANHETQYEAILSLANGKQDALTFDQTPTQQSNNPVTSDGIKAALDAKQDALTFDQTPTANSTNPVTSGGVKAALDAAGSTPMVMTLAQYLDLETPDNRQIYLITDDYGKPEIDYYMAMHAKWATSSDNDVANAILAARNGDIDLYNDLGWRVGDTRRIQIDSFTADGRTSPQQYIDLVITDFGDYNECGSLFQFDFKEALSRTFRAYSSAGSISYANSFYYSAVLPALVNALPAWLRTLLLTFDVIADTLVNSLNNTWASETVSNNKLALRSSGEIGGGVPYYTSQSNRVKTLGINGSAQPHRMRNHRPNSDRFWTVVANGSIDYNAGYYADSNKDMGMAPFGCL